MLNVKEHAPVYAAAVLEIPTAENLELARHAPKDKKKKPMYLGTFTLQYVMTKS
jgi:hypothetical protein